MKYIFKPRLLLFLIVFSASELFSQTIEQKLLVLSNDQTVGGNFIVAVQVQGTSLPAANTLGSATIDVQYDNSKISYQGAELSSWAFGPPDGYTRSATNQTTFIRVGVTGGGVGPSSGTVGFDIGSSYVTWVQLNFQIASGGVTSLTIASGSNQIGLFQNHANDPDTGPTGGVINNQTLTTPVTIDNEPTPVELNKFNAKAEGNNVELLWKTATEVNNYGFEVERASSMTSPIQGWEKIGFVNGNGNSNSPKDYTFIDKNPTGGSKFIYRLKQIDSDGKYEYSKEVEVEIVPQQYTLYQNYPNPFNPTTNIKFALPKSTKVTLVVYNLVGEIVTTLLNEDKEAGYYNVKFDAGSYSSGVYIYRLITGDFVQTKKMTLVK